MLNWCCHLLSLPPKRSSYGRYCALENVNYHPIHIAACRLETHERRNIRTYDVYANIAWKLHVVVGRCLCCRSASPLEMSNQSTVHGGTELKTAFATVRKAIWKDSCAMCIIPFLFHFLLRLFNTCERYRYRWCITGSISTLDDCVCLHLFIAQLISTYVCSYLYTCDDDDDLWQIVITYGYLRLFTARPVRGLCKLSDA